MTIFKLNSIPNLSATENEAPLASRIKTNTQSSLTWEKLLEKSSLHSTLNNASTLKLATITANIAERKNTEVSSKELTVIPAYQCAHKRKLAEQNNQPLKKNRTINQTDRTEINWTELDNLSYPNDSTSNISTKTPQNKLLVQLTRERKSFFCDSELETADLTQGINRPFNSYENYMPQRIEKSYKRTMREHSLPSTNISRDNNYLPSSLERSYKRPIRKDS